MTSLIPKKDGRIRRVTNHYNLRAWLEMVG